MKSERFIKYFIGKIHLFSGERKPGAREKKYDDIVKLFDALNRLKIPLEDFTSLGNSILSDEETLKLFAIKISKIITNKWGYTSIFQTSNVKEFLLNHPDLVRFHKLLTVCDENHWKKIVYTFLKAHLEERFNQDILYKKIPFDILGSRVKDGFSKVENPLKDGFELPSEFNLNYYDDSPIESYTTSVFVFHTINYLRNYFKGVVVEPSLAEHASAFEGIFKIFQQALKVQMAIINPEYVIDFKLKNSQPMILKIEYLRSKMHHPLSAEKRGDYFHLNDVSLFMKTSVSHTNRDWIAKILAAKEEFHDEYNKFKSDWPHADGHTYSLHKPEYFEDHYLDYVTMIEEEKERIERDCRFIHAQMAES
ncbi:hypothetical protein BY996DRAFT_3005061 [Phakopsora pachyrhizi]|nr:hypothetical protein BY996DRAFT_3005061 [Phakopsora pachyrhizi]